ncbi:S-layer homology domain-containing protein [Paenibacillus sp. LHD-117]|uniref:S-layer homology domain-containing protein n=1 Tax=Paenibacillus sp. LHD-117 TaxID=3071412 RepID=UPI0027E08476|nr:S-layer homology domain-containing protein [Paenibacillus sp. LHD-117]MDQ6422280.1 S-layer homology domain-containing protein [Paenibacillus sp. LHD-117]
MNKVNQKAIVIALAAALLGGGVALPYQAQAASAAPVATNQKAAAAQLDAAYADAIARLIEKGVLQGYGNGDIRPEKTVTNAELMKMVLLALELEESVSASQTAGSRWYDAYIASAVSHGLVESADKLAPNEPADSAVLAGMIAKALQRDTKSVIHWMEQLSISGKTGLTRGETAGLLARAENAIRSADAKILSVKALNAITLEVTFDAPLALADETTATASANFKFSGGLQLVNQPRLKTGSYATYIVPVQTMTEPAYSLDYKGNQSFEIAANDELIQLKDVRQVTADTFEVTSLREDGVIDYGYIISAYAGGRGANAAILDEQNRLNGKPMQIISSLATRKATLTPESGQPIAVSYVGFTQSTDGKQEPKFRLPQGTTLTPGVRYTLSSDWFEVREASFVASAFEPLTIASVEALNETTLLARLSQDPGDELFAYRSVQLNGSDGSNLSAQYKVQTRKGAEGTFEIQNGGKLIAGVTYEVVPVGAWAVTDDVRFMFESK